VVRVVGGGHHGLLEGLGDHCTHTHTHTYTQHANQLDLHYTTAPLHVHYYTTALLHCATNVTAPLTLLRH
jgi:hypothetical protein